jgi:hypothetical protein
MNRVPLAAALMLGVAAQAGRFHCDFASRRSEREVRPSSQRQPLAEARGSQKRWYDVHPDSTTKERRSCYVSALRFTKRRSQCIYICQSGRKSAV